LVHADISFFMYNNDNEVFNLPKATLDKELLMFLVPNTIKN